MHRLCNVIGVAISKMGACVLRGGRHASVFDTSHVCRYLTRHGWYHRKGIRATDISLCAVGIPTRPVGSHGPKYSRRGSVIELGFATTSGKCLLHCRLTFRAVEKIYHFIHRCLSRHVGAWSSIRRIAWFEIGSCCSCWAASGIFGPSSGLQFLAFDLFEERWIDDLGRVLRFEDAG